MENIEKQKTIEYDLLKQFVKICNDNNLRYYLIGGTLLGAVRHNGFIPWDDDIDVGMSRQDYEKFLSIAQPQLPEYVFLQTNKTDPNFPLNFAKLRNSNTTFIESSVKKLDINHGIYIDIFPLDSFPSGKIKQRLLLFKSKLLAVRISELYTIETNSQLKKLRNKVIINLMKIVYKSPYDAVKAKEKLNRKYENSNTEYMINYSGAWGEKEIFLRKWFEETVDIKFEEDVFCCPKHFDEYLTRVYGDYMQLPPPEQRISHHYNELIDCDNPYTDYVK